MAIDKKKLAKAREEQRSDLEGVAAEMYSDDDVDPGVLELLAKSKANRSKVRQAVESGLIVQNDDGWYFGRFKIDRVSLTVPDDATLGESLEFWGFLLDLHSRIQWLIGDLLVFADNREWGTTYAEKAAEFGYTVESLYNMASVCRRVEFSRRRENLSFGHHDAVAALDPKSQKKWLSLAEKNNWSIKILRQAIRDDGTDNTDELEPLTPWRKAIYTAKERYASGWKEMTLEQKQQAYQDVEALLNSMREWGLD